MANNQARGSYSLFFMLCLAIRYQHRIVNLFFAFDQSLSRVSHLFILITSMFLSLAITGLYCQLSSEVMNGVIISLIAQKVVLVILNLLMVKRPKLRRIKSNDKDLELNRPDANGKQKEKEEKFKEIISYKLTACDKMAFSIGCFLIFAVIAGSVFFAILQSRRIVSEDNSRWATMFIILLILDFGIFEFVAICVSTYLLKQVGQHPAAFGKMRNYIIKYGPRAIRTAKVSFGEKPKKKAPASPVKEEPNSPVQKKEERKRNGPANSQERTRMRAKREREKAMNEGKKKKEQQAAEAKQVEEVEEMQEERVFYIKLKISFIQSVNLPTSQLSYSLHHSSPIVLPAFCSLFLFVKVFQDFIIQVHGIMGRYNWWLPTLLGILHEKYERCYNST